MLINQDYHTISGNECILSCINNSLHHIYGKDLTEEIFLYGNGFAHEYHPASYNLSTGLIHSGFAYLDKMNISYVRERLGKSRKAKRSLECFIKEEALVSICAWSQLLTYNPVFVKSVGAPHYINILGLDSTEYYISDGYITFGTRKVYQCSFSKSNLLKAWKKMGYEYFLIKKPEGAKETKLVMEEETKLDLLKKMLMEYLTGNSCRGYKAVTCFLKELQHQIEQNQYFSALIQETFYSIKIMGFLKSREMLFYILQNHIYFPVDVRELYYAVIKKWNELWLRAVKYSVQNKREKILEIIICMQKLHMEEQKVLMKCLKVDK